MPLRAVPSQHDHQGKIDLRGRHNVKADCVHRCGLSHQPFAARRPGRLRAVVRIVVRDAENKPIHDRTVHTEGRIATAGAYLGRRLDTIELSEGIYEVSVTPLSDMSRLAPFRSALQIYYLFK